MESANDLIIVLGTNYENKPGITVGVSDELSKSGKFNAVNMVKELAREIKGGGGGQPHFATAGGKDISGLVGIPAKALLITS
jgi:alanyl-tRNA synthetase